MSEAQTPAALQEVLAHAATLASSTDATRRDEATKAMFHAGQLAARIAATPGDAQLLEDIRQLSSHVSRLVHAEMLDLRDRTAPAPGTSAPGVPAPGTPAPGAPVPGTPAPAAGTPTVEVPPTPVQRARNQVERVFGVLKSKPQGRLRKVVLDLWAEAKALLQALEANADDDHTLWLLNQNEEVLADELRMAATPGPATTTPTSAPVTATSATAATTSAPAASARHKNVQAAQDLATRAFETGRRANVTPQLKKKAAEIFAQARDLAETLEARPDDERCVWLVECLQDALDEAIMDSRGNVVANPDAGMSLLVKRHIDATENPYMTAYNFCSALWKDDERLVAAQTDFAARADAEELTPYDVLDGFYMLYADDKMRRQWMAICNRFTFADRIKAHNWHVTEMIDEKANAEAGVTDPEKKHRRFLTQHGRVIEHLPYPMFPAEKDFLHLNKRLLAEFKRDPTKFPSVYTHPDTPEGGAFYAPILEVDGEWVADIDAAKQGYDHHEHKLQWLYNSAQKRNKRLNKQIKGIKAAIRDFVDSQGRRAPRGRGTGDLLGGFVAQLSSLAQEDEDSPTDESPFQAQEEQGRARGRGTPFEQRGRGRGSQDQRGRGQGQLFNQQAPAAQAAQAAPPPAFQVTTVPQEQRGRGRGRGF